ncbi:hypothetical protein [Mycobacteroides salmoniphilum]|uniref:hypothetical protein n=1 Tax=Mycobacteroides salmoniphilum TaxID=404941 RepID=UPI0010D84206|nr:hypothetical protein [Mycobacteroides salmoniphilum]TDZ98781.1 hypothetical protein CCUG62472_00018 [Mycobacteroides salmoniphilum]
MASKFEFHQGPAEAGAAQWADAAGGASRVASGVSGLTDSPWSSDEIGSAFAEKFDPDRKQVIQNANKLAKQLRTIESNLTGAIKTIVTQEG